MVRGKALTRKGTRWFGPRVSARRLSIRRKVFSGSRPHVLYRSCAAGSFGSKVNLSPCTHGDLGRLGRVTDSASASTEAGRACLRATVGTSEVDMVGEGSTRTEKVQEESASSTQTRR